MHSRRRKSEFSALSAGSRAMRFVVVAFLASLMVLATGFQPAAAAQTPTVTTDKPDYGPTEIPEISGFDFAPGAELDVIVLNPKEQRRLERGKRLKKNKKKGGWDTLTTDGGGNFVSDYTPARELIIGALYEVRVYNTPWSGTLDEVPLAMTTFTDGPAALRRA